MENDETDSTNSSANNTEDKKNNWKWIIAIITIIFIISLIVIFLILPIPWRKYWYEDNGHFPWVGISAFIAAIGFIGNQIWERKRLNADIKSKSRIEWMVTVRDLLAPFMVNSGKIYVILSDLAQVTLNNDFEGRKIVESEYNDEKNKFSITYRKLLLYIPDTSDNKELLKSIEKVSSVIDERCQEAVTLAETYRQNLDKQSRDKLINFMNEIDPNDPQNEEQQSLLDNIDNLSKIGRQYFKQEWERAKKGE